MDIYQNILTMHESMNLKFKLSPSFIELSCRVLLNQEWRNRHKTGTSDQLNQSSAMTEHTECFKKAPKPLFILLKDII
jgi:hypothetical protein